MVLRLPDSWSNSNLEMLVFEERGKPEYPEKNLSEQGREPTTNSTYIWYRRRDLNPGHIGGRRVLSTLPHPCSQAESASVHLTLLDSFPFFSFFFVLLSNIFIEQWTVQRLKHDSFEIMPACSIAN